MSGDFVRRLPGGGRSFRNHRGAFTWFNLDPWLMLILLSIVGFGLVVLHSASDGNWEVVAAQLVRLGLGIWVDDFDCPDPALFYAENRTLAVWVGPHIIVAHLSLWNRSEWFSTLAEGARCFKLSAV